MQIAKVVTQTIGINFFKSLKSSLGRKRMHFEDTVLFSFFNYHNFLKVIFNYNYFMQYIELYHFIKKLLTTILK